MSVIMAKFLLKLNKKWKKRRKTKDKRQKIKVKNKEKGESIGSGHSAQGEEHRAQGKLAPNLIINTDCKSRLTFMLNTFKLRETLIRKTRDPEPRTNID